MASLNRALRKDLETIIKKARRVAEAGARKTIAQLGVGETEAPKHLSVEERSLRTRLRAHGRQLGDRRDTRTGAQVTTHLVQECAYEHWHRMLFARFLAEADLLIEPNSGVAITLDEAQELAREKATDWLELASDYAERMLPQIFRTEDPVLQIALPPETRSELEDLLKGLSKSAFEADDSLGWVYQFWQSDKKDEVNKSEVKIGADELPAVTQLFTEDYMVLFLLHNTLGAWWAGKVLAGNPTLAKSAGSEAALRAACRVGDIEWDYLRFVKDKAENGAEDIWRPAAGAFEGWPKAAKDITLLDPCMGSGHFLVFAMPILVAFRMFEEDLSKSAAVELVLRDNLFGLEIDPRCTQIAAFNLAFAAWRMVGYRQLPRLNLACSGLAIGVTKAEWLKLAAQAVTAADPAAKRDLLGVEENLLTAGLEARVRNGLEGLYELFAKAPWLGSLIDPHRAGGDIFKAEFVKLEPLLGAILAASETDDLAEMAVAAQGMAKAAELLGRHFVLVATNVPYLGRGKQDDVLKDYCGTQYPEAKTDLATCFIERCLDFCSVDGSAALVTPQTWLFLGTFKKIRGSSLKSRVWNSIARLGPAAFQDMNWWAATTLLVGLTRRTPSPDAKYFSVDAGATKEIPQKARLLRDTVPRVVLQRTQLQNPDYIINDETIDQTKILKAFASSNQGVFTADTNRYVCRFWEFPELGSDWSFYQMAPERNVLISGCHSVLRWESGAGSLAQSPSARVCGQPAWGKLGVAVSVTGHLYRSLYLGTIFDGTAAAITPIDEGDRLALTACLLDSGFPQAVRSVDPALSVTESSFLKVDFVRNAWATVASSVFPDGKPAASCPDPTQWMHSGAIQGSDSPLQVAVGRLVGYRWPRQMGSRFPECPQLEPDGLEKHADNDGIICLASLKGEPPAEQRLNALLADAFGVDWSAANLASLLAEVGFAGKSLEDWLRDGFFAQHCEMFHQRPFVWHIWDGRRDGFHVLVNYHRLAAPNGEGRRTLEKIIYSYLGDWIDRQRADQKAGVEAADARLAHAEYLKTELIKILQGDPPYDIFVRWKPLREQPIGWDPDINDGVRMNIRPFMAARSLNARGTNTCILRSTPKIKWDKDRGKEAARDKADYPWFWSWDELSADFAGAGEFNGNRWNDLHYSQATKQSARNRHRASLGVEA
jgi:hypothetical protein